MSAYAKPSALEMISFARYIKSYEPGRVRVCHPALKRASVAEQSRVRLAAEHGVTSVEMDAQTGSALIIYDAGILDKDAVLGIGIEWARWLKTV